MVLVPTFRALLTGEQFDHQVADQEPESEIAQGRKETLAIRAVVLFLRRRWIILSLGIVFVLHGDAFRLFNCVFNQLWAPNLIDSHPLTNRFVSGNSYYFWCENLKVY